MDIKKMASPHNSTLRYIPIWSTFLPHILYTHLQSKCSLHIKNKYIYTKKEKKNNSNIWINNFIDQKTSTPKFKHSERNKTVVHKQY